MVKFINDMENKELKLFDDIDIYAVDSRYTQKVGAPIYSPSPRRPHIFELVDIRKSEALINGIKKSNVSDEEKRFLIEAAKRHSIFNYSKIADYYTHASKEMQHLMEKSALVIIDFDKAIEYGYVRLSENIRRIQASSGRLANNNK